MTCGVPAQQPLLDMHVRRVGLRFDHVDGVLDQRAARDLERIHARQTDPVGGGVGVDALGGETLPLLHRVDLPQHVHRAPELVRRPHPLGVGVGRVGKVPLRLGRVPGIELVIERVAR